MNQKGVKTMEPLTVITIIIQTVLIGFIWRKEIKKLVKDNKYFHYLTTTKAPLTLVFVKNDKYIKTLRIWK